MHSPNENERKNWWLDKLQNIHPDWIDGDSESKEYRTADLVNHTQGIAFELKIEQGDHLSDQIENIEKLSNRIEEYFESANQKFKSYPAYKTVLLIELSSSVDMVQPILSGALRTIFFNSGGPTSAGLRSANMFLKMWENIGSVVFWPASSSQNAYYYDNRDSSVKNRVSKSDVEEMIGSNLEVMDHSL